MAGKSVTYKIGADTSDFIKGINQATKSVNNLEKQANAMEKGLKLDFDDDKFIQTQKVVQDALQKTNDKAEAIKKELKYLEDNDGINSEAYVKLQTELEKSENEAKKLNQQLKRLDEIKVNNLAKGIDDLSKGLETVAKKTAGISVAAGAAIVGITKLGKDTAATGALLQDYSDRLNISAEAMQRWEYLAMQSGVETEQLAKAIAKGRDAIGTALSGQATTAVKALESIGLVASDLPKDTNEGFTSIINALAKIEDTTLQAYYANEIFGERIATNLLPLINQGADNLSRLNSEFEEIGYMTNDQVKALADFDDEMNIVNNKLALTKAELGIALLPILEKLTTLLTDNVLPIIKNVAQAFSNLSPQAQTTITTILLLTTALSPLILICSKVLGIFGGMIKIIPTLIAGLKSLDFAAKSTYLGFASLLGTMGLIANLIGDWKNMSTVEKILKSLAVAALAAAAAMTIFHASWSLGLAVGGIVAGVTAGIAAIKSAGENIGVETNLKDQEILASSNYTIPKEQNNVNNTYNNEDNSNYEININLNASGDLNYDSKALADEVIKQIIIKKQSMGY